MKKSTPKSKKNSEDKLPKILTDLGEKKNLMKIFEVSHVTVREALKGNISTPLALRIRKAAIARGGSIAPQMYLPGIDDYNELNYRTGSAKAMPNEKELSSKKRS